MPTVEEILGEERRRSIYEALAQSEDPEAQRMLRALAMQNMALNARDGEQPRGRVSVEGSGGVGGGLASGGGALRYQMLTGRDSDLALQLGGGGALGNVRTPEGRQRVREGGGDVRLNFGRRF